MKILNSLAIMMAVLSPAAAFAHPPTSNLSCSFSKNSPTILDSQVSDMGGDFTITPLNGQNILEVDQREVSELKNKAGIFIIASDGSVTAKLRFSKSPDPRKAARVNRPAVFPGSFARYSERTQGTDDGCGRDLHAIGNSGHWRIRVRAHNEPIYAGV